MSGRLQLVAGETLAHYQVEAKLGEGGMETVYRAFDTKLHRKVALMVLALERFSDMERKLRLMREARAASALNHPNIANEDRERGSATVGRIGRDTRGPRKSYLALLAQGSSPPLSNYVGPQRGFGRHRSGNVRHCEKSPRGARFGNGLR